jgi:multidrug efflux pump subunit AcrA (membrane-fusion protein)
MRRSRRIIAAIILVGVAAGTSFWFLNRDSVVVDQYLTAPVTSEQIVNTVSTTGSIVDQYTYQVDTSGEMVLKQIAGVVTTSGTVPVNPKDDWTVAKINKKDGATVKKDQTIITLRNFDGSTRNITAPSNGQVLSVNTLEGFSASGAVATIGTGRILVSVSVTESELNSFIPNQPVAIAVNSSDQTTYGSVIFVSPVTDSSVTQGASYRVLIEVAPGVFPDGVKSGMTATVEFPIADNDDVRYTNAKFIYEYEFSLSVDNEASLVSKNGSLVTSTPSLTSNLDSWRVTAKESGYVRDIFTAPKALVSGSLIELGVAPVLAAVEVSEFDIGQLAVGQRATFSTSDQPEEFEAEVLSISSKALVDTSAVAKFKVYLKPLDSNASFRIGASVRANIILQATSSQKAVPVQALKEVNNEYVVEVLDSNGVAIERQVQVGVIGDEFAEIISGLELEDEVVIGNRAPQDVLPTQPTGPFGEGGNDSNETE